MSVARSSLLAALVVVSAAVTIPSAAQETPAHHVARRIVVHVTNLRSDAGVVLGGLYARADRWLEEDAADGDCRAPIRNGRALCVFENVAAGAVAFAGMHDEDGDGALDRDFLGLPSEGYAFSNDAREPFGPPSFAAASFGTSSLTVRARYGI